MDDVNSIRALVNINKYAMRRIHQKVIIQNQLLRNAVEKAFLKSSVEGDNNLALAMYSPPPCPVWFVYI